MYIIGILLAAVIIGAGVKLYQMNREKIQFFITGLDSRFTMREISLLWKAAKLCNLSEPLSLFWSLQSLTNCISQIKSHAELTKTDKEPKTQQLLSKLYGYRTKIEKDADQKKGIESTHDLVQDQKLRIILPGKGVFSSVIVNNARELTVSMPTQKKIVTVEGRQWTGKTVSVYLWRTNDARYVFDTDVMGEGVFLGRPALYLRHTDKLLRTQKRQAVRAHCHLYASLFIIKTKNIDYNFIETKPGYRCLLEDISESGALVRIGGKGIPNIQIKLQYQLEGKLIIMFGTVRTVEYNKELNQSRLHFECIHIDPVMKNEILAYVYNILPEHDKEIYDALTLTDADKTENNDESDGQHDDEDSEEHHDGQTDTQLPEDRNGGQSSGKEMQDASADEAAANIPTVSFPDKERDEHAADNSAESN